nr:hypothetical protein [Clostridium gasigenes]
MLGLVDEIKEKGASIKSLKGI